MDLFKTAKKVELFVIVAIIGVIGIVYALTQKPALAPQPQTRDELEINNNQNSVQKVSPTSVYYQGVEGGNALELLRASHEVFVKHYDFGDLVTSIDGVVPDSKHFWGFYVNGKQAEVGASAYTTKASDQIEWKLEEIK